MVSSLHPCSGAIQLLLNSPPETADESLEIQLLKLFPLTQLCTASLQLLLLVCAVFVLAQWNHLNPSSSWWSFAHYRSYFISPSVFSSGKCGLILVSGSRVVTATIYNNSRWLKLLLNDMSPTKCLIRVWHRLAFSKCWLFVL